MMKESDLYPALKRFLESQGYAVKGEGQDCDVLAVRGEEAPVVVELKRALGLDVILQAIDRQSLTARVYIGIPESSRARQRRWRQMIKLLRMLGLGLLVIDPKRNPGGVTVRLDPDEYRPRQSRRGRERLRGEFAMRVGDPNRGGTDRRRSLMTAYRQRALAIARFHCALGRRAPCGFIQIRKEEA